MNQNNTLSGTPCESAARTVAITGPSVPFDFTRWNNAAPEIGARIVASQAFAGSKLKLVHCGIAVVVLPAKQTIERALVCIESLGKPFETAFCLA
jgi:hypothetical protein